MNRTCIKKDLMLKNDKNMKSELINDIITQTKN
jgi:hypothetical protein